MSLAGYLPPVIAQVVAEVGKFSAGMGTVKAEMTGLEAATTKLAAAGKVAFAGAAIAAAAVGFEATKMAMNFDQQLTLIHTQAGAVHEDLGLIGKAILDMAPKVGQGPEKLAEAMYHIESTGMRGAQALDILENSAKLASIGIADLDNVTYAMSGVMAVGMKDIHSAADAIAFMNATVGMGDMRMEALTRAVGTGILPSMKAAGLGMVDFAAALSTLTDNSVPADEAATRLRMTIALMAAPTKAASEALEAVGIGQLDAAHALTNRDAELSKFGITVGQLAADMQQPNGLLVAVKDLKAHLEGLSPAAAAQVIEHAFGGGRTSGAILTLLEESDKLASKYDQLGTSADRARNLDAAWAEQQKQFSQQWHEFVATLQVVGVQIGNWLIPKIQATIKWMRENSEVVKILALIIGGVLVAAMVAFTASMIAMGVAALANPVTWIIIAIIAAVALLAIGIYELVKHWGTVWAWIKRIALDVWHWLVDAWHWVLGKLIEGANWVTIHVVAPIVRAFTTYLLPVIRIVVNTLAAIWNFLWGLFSTVIDGTIARINLFVSIWQVVWGKVVDIAKWVWDHGLGQVFHFIVEDGIGRIKLGIALFRDAWDGAWKAITTIVDTAWKIIKPIVDAIGTALHKAGDATGWLADHAGAAGRGLGHLLGFDTGGVVPGPTGAPRLVVAHGGEEILTPAQRSAMGRAGIRASAAATGTGGDIVLHARFVMPDGRHVRTEVLRHARRSGQQPSDMFSDSAVQFLAR